MKKIYLKNLLQKTSIVWWPIGFYFLVVFILSFFGSNLEIAFSKEILQNRILYLVAWLLCFLAFNFVTRKVWVILSFILVYALLSVLYKETASLNQLFFPPIDAHLLELDQKLFGFQPSLVFSEKLNQAFFSELFFMGYFSYYLMPIAILVYLYIKFPEKIQEFAFYLIGSFVVYYLFFILVPAYGPQFYFNAPQNQIEAQGLFGNLIKIIQKNGEAPTAAFPSSHVGIAYIMLIWLHCNKLKLRYFLAPFVFILTFSTIYIKAHWAIDSIVGLFSVALVYPLVTYIYKRIPCQYKSVK